LKYVIHEKFVTVTVLYKYSITMLLQMHLFKLKLFSDKSKITYIFWGFSRLCLFIYVIGIFITTILWFGVHLLLRKTGFPCGKKTIWMR